MNRMVVLMVVAACSKGRPDDCAIVRDQPATAMAELSKRYPNNPVKVAQTIEKCVAPTGDECERIAKVIAAIPTLAPQLSVPSSDAVKTCRTAPPEFRRCMLPSNALARASECSEILTREISSIEIKPSTAPVRDCGFVVIYIDLVGTWLATGKDDKSRCFAPRNKAGKLDIEWLDAQLRRAKEHPCHPSSAEIAAADDVPYQDVITAMDIAIKTGFMDTGISTPATLAVPLAKASPKGAGSECPVTVIPVEPEDKPAATPPSAAAPSTRDRLANAPVLIITTDKITLKVDDKSTDVATLADAHATTNLDVMTKTLRPTRDGLLIMQADQRTPQKVINAVVATAKAAGYDNILFAVKNR